jgi:hypothetical protein
VTWSVLFHEDFHTEFGGLDDDLQDELLAHARLLAEFGPNLGRPTVDTLKGSRHANMKELRFSWAGVLLVGGDKGGADQRRFYKRLIQVADDRYNDHIATLKMQTQEVSRGKKAR